MRYILVTLVGERKLYSKDPFFQHISKLNQPPEEILVSATKDIFNQFTEGYREHLSITWIHGEKDTGNQRIRSTTSAREALRQALLKSDVEWSLWLDNDILIPCNLIEKFLELLDAEPNLLYVNAYHPARQGQGQIRHGLGSSFIHRDVLAAYPFTEAQLRGKSLGDDYIWKLVIAQLFSIFHFKGRSGIIFNVKHLAETGEIHEFTEEQRRKLI